MQWGVLPRAYPDSLEGIPKPEIRVGEAVDAPERLRVVRSPTTRKSHVVSYTKSSMAPGDEICTMAGEENGRMEPAATIPVYGNVEAMKWQRRCRCCTIASASAGNEADVHWQ